MDNDDHYPPLNLLPPYHAAPPNGVGVVVQAADADAMREKLTRLAEQGVLRVEIAATGAPGTVHTPDISPAERAQLRAALLPCAQIAVLAPHQQTFDVSLVSPSAAIRRASVAEIWSACRFVKALGGGTVVIRTGTAPLGMPAAAQRQGLIECLQTLDRMAGEQNARIGVLNHDYFADAAALGLLEMLPLRHTGVALDISGQEEFATDSLSWLGRSRVPLLHLRVSAAVSPNAELSEILRPDRFHGMVCITETDPEQADWEATARVWETLLRRDGG